MPTAKAPAKKTSSKKGATAKKAFVKKAPAKKAAAAKKRAPNAAFIKAMTPTTTLAAVIGAKSMQRAEVTKKIWDYINKHNLQDEKSVARVKADSKLKALFDKDVEKKKGNDPGPSITMFELNKAINRHLK